ncbi:short chain dehydrogenase [Crenobacter sp. SG2303]|uniref:Short chain dehydrogenase n=1 Tax=Crenobacter oryzisoli TaxID=3056844 RepID=A0ABT7XSE7_9NEIS|nr:short chain dehydrogenase [Crenobacter sp. SG2303]MDN0076464.1 short chain dehydrogenase [Crenobacter sp. SG2303]
MPTATSASLKESSMKIAVFGASGTLGRAVVERLGQHHDIISIGRTSGDYRADLTDIASIRTVLEKIGPLDALIATAGQLHFGPLAETTPEQFQIGLNDKLLGQVNLVLAGQHHLNDGGSITLTSGIVSDEPIRNGSNATTVNAALEGFVRAAALELPRGLRVNVVSPNVVVESWKDYGPLFPGVEAVPVARVALAYQRSVEGIQSGRVLRVW